MTHNVTLCYHKNNNNNNECQKWVGSYSTDLRPDTLVKGGKKEGNPKCDTFLLICSPIYLEKCYKDRPKRGIGSRPPIFPTVIKVFVY